MTFNISQLEDSKHPDDEDEEDNDSDYGGSAKKKKRGMTIFQETAKCYLVVPYV